MENARDFTRIERTLIWAAGRDVNTLVYCPEEEINRVVSMGLMVFIPPFVGLFSYTYAAMFLDASPVLAVLIALMCSAVVLVLDRSIMAFGDNGRVTGSMIGRVLLAVLIGLFVAEPLIIRVFDDVITEHIAADLDDDKRKAARAFDKKKEESYARVAAANEYAKEREVAFLGEMDGTSGTGRPFYGPEAERKEGLMKAAQVSAAEVKIEEIVYREKVEEERKARMKELEQQQAMSLVARIDALSELSGKSFTILVASWALRLLLLMVELTPLMIKLGAKDEEDMYGTVKSEKSAESKHIFISGQKERIQLAEAEAKKRANELMSEYHYNEVLQEIEAAFNEGELVNSALYDRTMAMLERKEQIIDEIDDPIVAAKIQRDIDQVFENIESRILRAAA